MTRMMNFDSLDYILVAVKNLVTIVSLTTTLLYANYDTLCSLTRKANLQVKRLAGNLSSHPGFPYFPKALRIRHEPG